MERSNFTVGEIKEVFRDAVTAKFEWVIPNYFNFWRAADYWSPTVKYFNAIWHLEINFNSHLVRLSRNSPTSVFQESVRCNVGHKKANGRKEVIARNNLFKENIESLGWRHTAISSQVTSLDDFTFPCTLWKDNSPYEEGVSRVTQTEDASCSNSRINEDHSKDISILLEHLKELRLSGDHHDFLMKIKDKEFRAHKCVLQARSPVFAAMFRSQMAESADNSITIDDCDPDAFGEFLSYVYTGKVDISSASHALGLYYVGDKYDFPRLKEMSVDFLKNSLTATRISDVINMAAKHDEGELLQKSLVYLATHLQEVFLTVEWQRFIASNPTAANEMCIKALQSSDICITLNKK